MAFPVEDLLQTAGRITYGLKTYSERKCGAPQGSPNGGVGGPLMVVQESLWAVLPAQFLSVKVR